MPNLSCTEKRRRTRFKLQLRELSWPISRIDIGFPVRVCLRIHFGFGSLNNCDHRELQRVIVFLSRCRHRGSNNKSRYRYNDIDIARTALDHNEDRARLITTPACALYIIFFNGLLSNYWPSDLQNQHDFFQCALSTFIKKSSRCHIDIDINSFYLYLMKKWPSL